MPITSTPLTYTYTTVPGDGLIITGLDSVRRQDGAISITDALNHEPNRCDLTIGDNDSTSAPEPPLGQNVVIENLGRKVFAGTVVIKSQTSEELSTQLKWDLNLIDFTWQLNRLIPFGTYVDTPAETVIADLASFYLPGFTLTHVETGLPNVSLELDGTKNWAGVLDDMCAQIGQGCKWKVDYDLDLHFGMQQEIDEVPDELNNTTNTTMLRLPVPRKSEDLTQVRNRVFVKGTGFFEMVEDATAQGELAALVGGDGVIEAPVINRPELTSSAACIAYGNAVLSVYARPIVTLEYYTRDPKTASGKHIVANMTDPPIVGTFLIQSATLDEINDNDETFPRYHVLASSVLFTIEDIFKAPTVAVPTVVDIPGNAATADLAHAVAYPSIAPYVNLRT